MTDRPIIFSAPMVLALLAGRKTQTRRLASSPLRRCEVGDRLYVREAHHRTNDDSSSYLVGYDTAYDPSFETIYRDIPSVGRVGFFAHSLGGWGGRTSRNYPGMHMPRWASRLTLIVEGVKVEPLQVISEDDAIAEGIRPLPGDGPNRWTVDVEGWGISAPTAVGTYELLWKWLHDNEGQRWEDNPDVVALTFRVIHCNIDQVAA